MQPPPLSPPPGVSEFVAELLDAKWVVTTVIAVYAAVVSTLQVLIQDWWVHRPRLKVIFYQSFQTGNGERIAMLSINVINRGYASRRIADHVSFEFDAVRAAWPIRMYRRYSRNGEGHTVTMLTDPTYLAGRPPGMLQPSDGFQMAFLRGIAIDAAKERAVASPAKVRAFIMDGTNRRFNSNWITLEFDQGL